MKTEQQFRHLIIPAIMLMLPFMTACGDDDEPEPLPQPEPTEIGAIYEGTTVTAPVNDPASVYSSTTGTYRFVPDKDGKTATLCIDNANFLQGMPQLGTMEFLGINYTVSGHGTDEATARFSSKALTPEIAGRPFPAFPISDLTATMHPGKKLDIEFICTYRGTPFAVTFTGTPAK